MTSEPEAAIAVDAETREARAALAAAGVDIVNRDDLPIFDPGAIAAALVDRAGRIICASPAFAAVWSEAHIDDRLLQRALRGAPPATTLVETPSDDGLTDTAVFAYALAAHAAAWRLPPDIAAAAAARPDHVVILTSQAVPAARPLEAACRAYGLTGLQTRVALEVIRTGNVRTAAQRLGISYQTARPALADAMQRARAPRLPALVGRLTSLAFGVLPRTDRADVLGDIWGLSARQAAIAALVAEGLSRAEAASALGLSEALVKKELDRVYLTLKVGTGAALARKLVEAQALRWLTTATGGDIGFLEPAAEPLRFVHRADGTRIAFSDYGPASGKPVLVVHSSLTSRPVGRRLVRALQAAGYRPIAIDRPGFGLTDEVPGLRAGAHDPWAAAAEDAIRVLDHLKLRAVDLVARGAAPFVLALERAAPRRLGRAVLVNPDPHELKGEHHIGVIGAMKQAFRRNPAIIRLTLGLLARQITYERLLDMHQRSYRGSPPDELAIQDPDLFGDVFRAHRTVATGSYNGIVNEQLDFTRGAPPAPLAGTTGWRVLVAAHDTMHDPRLVAAAWRALLPDAQHRVVPDTGRLLAFSHPHYVVEALTEPDGGGA